MWTPSMDQCRASHISQLTTCSQWPGSWVYHLPPRPWVTSDLCLLSLSHLGRRLYWLTISSQFVLKTSPISPTRHLQCSGCPRAELLISGEVCLGCKISLKIVYIWMFTLPPQVIPDQAMITTNKIFSAKSNHWHTTEYLRENIIYFSGEINNSPLPVVLFIHGDSFDWGSGNLYDGSLMAAFSDVVVVTINYRLGVLGNMGAQQSMSQKIYEGKKKDEAL